MWLWTRQEAKQIDTTSIQSGISAETLMETAGQNSVAQISKIAPHAKKAILLCGPGNNGGDSFVVARELLKKGLHVTVVEIPGDSKLRKKKASEFTGTVLSIEEFLKKSPRADIWIDGLFGIGLNKPLEGKILSLIEKVNSQFGIKISLDTPSGLDVDNGNILGAAFQAHWTLTVGRPKPGFYFNHGPRLCGKIRVVDAGFPSEICKRLGRSVFLLTPSLVKKWIPQRKATDNKSHGGKTLIWAGSPAMPGAAILACQAASRVGSGYVYTSEPEVVKAVPHAIPWKQNEFQSLSSVLIGPALGAGILTKEALENLAKTSLPVVVDADALTVAAKENLYPFHQNWICTPHAGELSRFIELDAKAIEADRLTAAKIAFQKMKCPVLLKGFHTVIRFQNFSVVIPTGNVALAKGGSGDVLGGMIAGFLSQGVSYEKAPLLAAFIHGWIADQWIRNGNDLLSLTPEDLLKEIPKALHQIRD